MMHSATRLWAIVAAFAFPICAQAQQAYPAKPIRLIMTVQGGAEVTVRLMANKVGEALGQPLVIEPLPGAGGSVGADTVMRAAPDGYTLMYTGASVLVIRPFVAKKHTL